MDFGELLWWLILFRSERRKILGRSMEQGGGCSELIHTWDILLERKLWTVFTNSQLIRSCHQLACLWILAIRGKQIQPDWSLGNSRAWSIFEDLQKHWSNFDVILKCVCSMCVCFPLEKKWQPTPLQYSCQENSMNRGTWWATVLGSQRVGHDWGTNTFTLSLEVDVCTLKCDGCYIYSVEHPSSRRKWRTECSFSKATEENLGKAINLILYGRKIFINCLRTSSTW